MQRTTIYLDTATFEDDNGTFRTLIADSRGNEVEIIACPPRWVSALKDGIKFWEEVQAKQARAAAEAHIASLPRGRMPKRVG